MKADWMAMDLPRRDLRRLARRHHLTLSPRSGNLRLPVGFGLKNHCSVTARLQDPTHSVARKNLQKLCLNCPVPTSPPVQHQILGFRLQILDFFATANLPWKAYFCPSPRFLVSPRWAFFNNRLSEMPGPSVFIYRGQMRNVKTDKDELDEDNG